MISRRCTSEVLHLSLDVAGQFRSGLLNVFFCRFRRNPLRFSFLYLYFAPVILLFQSRLRTSALLYSVFQIIASLLLALVVQSFATESQWNMAAAVARLLQQNRVGISSSTRCGLYR